MYDAARFLTWVSRKLSRKLTSIIKEWKNEDNSDLYKIKFEVVEPITVKSGTAGEMYDPMLDKMLPGGIE